MKIKIATLGLLSVFVLTLAVSISILTLKPVNAAAGDFDLDGRTLLLNPAGTTSLTSASSNIAVTISSTPISTTIDSQTKFIRGLRSASNSTFNSTTLTDTELTFSADASSRYNVEFVVHYTTGASAQPSKFFINGPSGYSYDGVVCGQAVSGAGNDCIDITEASSTSFNVTGQKTVVIKATIFISSTSGSVTLQWAQNVTDAGNPHTVYAGSIITWAKIA